MLPVLHDHRKGYFAPPILMVWPASNSYRRVTAFRLAHVPPHLPHSDGLQRNTAWDSEGLDAHADIKTTMNVYGGAMPQEMRDANAAEVKMAIQ